MNSVEIKDRIDFLNNLERAPRFYFSSYEAAVNSAIKTFTKQTIGGVKSDFTGPQIVQQIRTRLYTLVKESNPTITTVSNITTKLGVYTKNHVNFPTDYFDFLSVSQLMDGFTSYAKPIDYGQLIPTLENTFLKPSETDMYYNEDSTGLILYRVAGGTLTSLTLEYIKTPATYVLGLESQRISAGGAVLTNGLSYIAMEESVQNAVTYKSGTQFTAVGTALTSGRVILASNTTTSDLPVQMHDQICEMASGLMMGVTGNLNSAMLVDKEVNKNP